MDLLGSVIAAHPCPPLPLQCTRVDKQTDRSMLGFANTHHILMQTCMHAMRRDCVADNVRRQKEQTELTGVFLAVFSGSAETPGSPPDPATLYTAATVFTRGYLRSFMPDRTNVPDARFAPFDEVSSSTYQNNPLVRASCEHLAGLIYYDRGGEEPYDDILAPLKHVPFSGILSKYADVHRARGVLEAAESLHSISELTD